MQATNEDMLVHHGWAETGGGDGGKGTMTGEEKPILTGAEFLTLSTGVGAGAGASVAITALGVDGLVAAGASALIAVGGAALGGVASAGMLGYGFGTWLNKTDMVQGIVGGLNDWLVHGGNPDVYNHIKTPDVHAVGPWPIDPTTSTTPDHMYFYTASPTDTSAILYDTPIDAIEANVAGLLGHSDLYALWTIP